MILEIGGGTCPQDGAVNLDPAHGTGEWRRLAQDAPWPCPDDHFDHVHASHVMEHIPAGDARITVMNEAWRVLRPGGTFTIIVPLLVPGTWQAIADPTHVSWWVAESFHYFTGALTAQADYGIRYWRPGTFEVVGGWEGHWTGIKP